MTPNAAARTVLGVAGILFALDGLHTIALAPLVLATPVEPAEMAVYVRREAWASVVQGAVAIAIGGALFRLRAHIAERIEPATEGDGSASLRVSALAFAVVGLYYLVPAAAHIFSALAVDSFGAGVWKSWAISLGQLLLSLALILGSRRLAAAWSA